MDLIFAVCYASGYDTFYSPVVLLSFFIEVKNIFFSLFF